MNGVKSYIKVLLMAALSGLLFQVFPDRVLAQNSPYTVRLNLKDKEGTPYSIQKAHEFLSEKAIERRLIQNIPVTPDDLPLSPTYINHLKDLGYKPFNPSKWFNSVLVKVNDSSELEQLNSLDFILSSKVVAISPSEKRYTDKFISENTYHSYDFLSDSSEYGLAYEQIRLHRADILHDKGYRGSGIDIAVIDAGFYQVNTLPAFSHLWSNNKIVSWRDYVAHDKEVFSDHTHGMKVLSIIGGKIPSLFSGTAPEAAFHLLRSEDGASEMLVEEDNWVTAAEYADSIGAKIINTSLGYSTFDYPWMNYSYDDMDGKTTRISQAAVKASNRGILVIVSAGNEGNKDWKYITAPADANQILSIGAIDVIGNLAPFSSIGPTIDSRIKPDLVATGWRTYHQYPDGRIIAGNGTSFAAPIVSGLAACLWQAHPTATNTEIMEALFHSSNSFSDPGNFYGYGIPDLVLADEYLRSLHSENPVQAIKLIQTPYIAKPVVMIESDVPIGKIQIKLFTTDGKILNISENNTESTFFQLPIANKQLKKNQLILIQVITNQQKKTFKYIP